MEARFQTLCVFVLLLLFFWNREVNMSFEFCSYCKLISHQVIIPVTFLDQFLQFFPVYQEFLGILYPDDVLPCHFWRMIPQSLPAPRARSLPGTLRWLEKKSWGIPTQRGRVLKNGSETVFGKANIESSPVWILIDEVFFTQILPGFCDYSYLISFGMMLRME